MQTSADSSQAERATLESSYSASSAHGTARTEAQRLGLLACLATSKFTRNLEIDVRLPGSFRRPSPRMRTSADRSQPERASLESSYSASSAHGTARTEAQKLGLLSCLATSNFKCSFGVSFRVPPAALLPKCQRVQIAGRQKGLAWKAVAQPHLPMALHTQRHRDCGCLIVLPPQTSDVTW